MDMKKYAEAIEFAAIAHDGAYRKGTRIPYITHVVEAGLIAMTMTQDDNTIIAAILHDIVEDTSYKLNDIQSLFGTEVADLVSYESEDKMKEIPAKESWKIRKEAFLKHLEDAPLEAKIVCLADKLSNMRMSVKTFAEKGDDMWLAFNQKDKKEQEWYYRSIYQKCTELEDTDAYKEYVQCCDKVFGGQNDNLDGNCVDSNPVMYDPLIPEEKRVEWLQGFVESELEKITKFFDDKIPAGELAKPYVFLSNDILPYTFGEVSEKVVNTKLDGCSGKLNGTGQFNCPRDLERVIGIIKGNIEENKKEGTWDDLNEIMPGIEDLVFKEGTDNDKEVLSEIMEILSTRMFVHGYLLGKYLPDRHQIIIYYRAIEKALKERGIQGIGYQNEYYKAQLSSVIAHEYFHAMHHAMCLDNVPQDDPWYDVLWNDTHARIIKRYQKTEIKEALADFFSVLWCLEQANTSYMSAFEYVADNRFKDWKKLLYSAWPYAKALYLMKDDSYEWLPRSLSREAIRIGKEWFSKLLEASIETPENAYAVLRKRQ